MGNPPASLEISFIENDLDTNGKLKVQIIYKKGTRKKTFPKIQFVNWPPNLSFVKNKCKYIFASGKKKGEMCCKFTDYTSQFCKNHEKIMKKRKSKEVKKLNKKLTLSNKTVKELKKICKENSIKKYSKLRKAELVELIKKNSKKTVIEHNKIITI